MIKRKYDRLVQINHALTPKKSLAALYTEQSIAPCNLLFDCITATRIVYFEEMKFSLRIDRYEKTFRSIEYPEFSWDWKTKLRV
jgi:hypothetical protein